MSCSKSGVIAGWTATTAQARQAAASSTETGRCSALPCTAPESVLHLGQKWRVGLLRWLEQGASGNAAPRKGQQGGCCVTIVLLLGHRHACVHPVARAGTLAQLPATGGKASRQTFIHCCAPSQCMESSTKQRSTHLEQGCSKQRVLEEAGSRWLACLIQTGALL